MYNCTQYRVYTVDFTVDIHNVWAVQKTAVYFSTVQLWCLGNTVQYSVHQYSTLYMSTAQCT